MTTFTRLPFSTPTELVRNRMPNGSFENNLTGWIGSTNSSSLGRLTRPDGADPVKGGYCAGWIATAAGASQIRGIDENNIPTVPGQTVSVAADYRLVGTARTAAVGFEFLNGSGTVIGSAVFGADVAVTSAAWATAVHSAVAPALTANTRVMLRFMTAGAGQQLYADAVIVTQGGAPTSPYFDGATADAPPLEYRWTGAAFASASTKNQQGAGDTLTPPLIVRPYRVEEEARTVVHTLLQSSDVRYTFNDPEAARGELQLTYAAEADAIAARAFFRVRGLFVPSDGAIDGLPAEFAVAEGRIRVEQDTADAWHVFIPWKGSLS